jgi:hypothetical protein
MTNGHTQVMNTTYSHTRLLEDARRLHNRHDLVLLADGKPSYATLRAGKLFCLSVRCLCPYTVSLWLWIKGSCSTARFTQRPYPAAGSTPSCCNRVSISRWWRIS